MITCRYTAVYIRNIVLPRGLGAMTVYIRNIAMPRGLGAMTAYIRNIALPRGLGAMTAYIRNIALPRGLGAMTAYIRNIALPSGLGAMTACSMGLECGRNDKCQSSTKLRFFVAFGALGVLFRLRVLTPCNAPLLYAPHPKCDTSLNYRNALV